MEELDKIIFYAIDKAIRSYRQYAQKRIREEGYKITVDQWLVIKAILQQPEITQKEISIFVFKDNASVTRIISNLVRDGYLSRELDKTDRRKSKLYVTNKGKAIIRDVQTVIDKNRGEALKGIDSKSIDTAFKVMRKISENLN